LAIPSLEDIRDITLEEYPQFQITSTATIFLDLELDSDYFAAGSLLHWLLYTENFNCTVDIFICKSQFVNIHCANCQTKSGKIFQTDNRKLLNKLPQQPKHFSVLEFYTFKILDLKLCMYPEKWYIVTSNKERYDRILEVVLSKFEGDCKPKFIDLKDADNSSNLPYEIKTAFNDRPVFEKPKVDCNVPMLNGEDTVKLEDHTLSLVAENIIKWIHQLKSANQKHLPKTLTKLENAIRKRQCLYRYSIDKDIILNTLIQEGYIDGCFLCGSIFYPKRKTEVYISKPLPLVYLSDIQTLGLDKMKSWIQQQAVLPTTIEAFKNHIDSIRIAYSVASGRVIEKLLDNKVVAYKEMEITNNDNPWALYSSSRDSDLITYLQQ